MSDRFPDFLARLRRAQVVAVLRAVSVDAAVDTAKRLVDGGITGIEITFSTPRAELAISRCVRDLPGALVGAGTVLDPIQATLALDAGAAFLVSPHTDGELIRIAIQRRIPFCAGALTPTEVVDAWNLGAAVVKLFPGSAVGPSYVKTLRGPLPHIPLMPTGGVDATNLAEWIGAGAVAVGIGGGLGTGDAASINAIATAMGTYG